MVALFSLPDELLAHILHDIPVRDVVPLTIAAPQMTRRAGLLSALVQRQRGLLQQVGVDCTLLPNESLNLRYIARLSGGLNGMPAWFLGYLHEIMQDFRGGVAFTWPCMKRIWTEFGACHFRGLLQFVPYDADPNPALYESLEELMRAIFDYQAYSHDELRLYEHDLGPGLWNRFSHVIGLRDLEPVLQTFEGRSQALDVVDELVDEDEEDDEEDEDWDPSEDEASLDSVEEDAEFEEDEENQETDEGGGDVDGVVTEMMESAPDRCDNPMCPCTACLCCASYTDKDMTGPVAQAAFAHSPAFGPGLLPRTILQWSPETRTRCSTIIRYSIRQHHPTLELLLEELLAARRPHACARSYFIRGAVFGRNGSLCVQCD